MECIANFFQTYQTIIAAIIAGIIAFRFDRQKATIDRETFMRELFHRYNEKYDQLNEHMIKLVDNSEVSVRERDMAIKKIPDYINLCSEEFYWRKKNFVDDDVWKCWEAGMVFYYNNSELIRKYIEHEKDIGSSYYNISFLNMFDGVQKREIL